MSKFRGCIEQTPPIYSALKFQGKRGYELARAGIPVEIKPRQITIFKLELVEFKLPLLTIELECSKGTYVRSLAHDLGQYLGCGGYLVNLIRTQYGPFRIENALPVSEIKCIFHKGMLDDYLQAVDTPLLDWSAIVLDAVNEARIKKGVSISLNPERKDSGDYCRAYGSDGRFLAVLHLEQDSNLWHPDKVFALN